MDNTVVNITEAYDSLKVDKVRKMIFLQQSAGKKMLYEIVIDDIKLIGKTDDVSLFDQYEEFIDSGTKKVEVLIYPGEKSKANKKYTYILKNDAPASSQTLGEVEIAKQIRKEVDVVKEQLKSEQLTRELKRDLDLEREKNRVAEEYITELETEIAQLEDKVKKNDNFGKISDTITTFVLPKLLPESNNSDAPLSGTAKKQEASFSEVDGDSPLSETEKNQLALLKWMQQNLSKVQLMNFQNILNHLKKHPEHIQEFASLITNANK